MVYLGSIEKKLLSISLDLLDAKQSGILYGTNETKIRFLPNSMWDRGVMDKLNGRGVKDMELDIILKNRDLIWVSLSIDAIKENEKENDIVEIRVMAMDISRRKTLEKQLFHAQKMEAIGTLTRVRIHPLTPGKG